MPQASVYSGRSATETAIKSLHSPRILHIATHGFFLPNLDQDTERRGQQALDRPPVEAMNREDPLVRAGLALACVNQPCGGPDDGILTALEATTLDLQGTQLVVLSACDTGVGDVVNGDGIYGLRRAFHIAGAEHTMISLWKVDDFATSDLMTEFYRQLATGSAPQDALASVQRRWARQGNRQHPFYWASFLISDR